jgi:hypothetical protein
MAEPKILKMEPCATDPLGSRGSAKLAAFFTPCAAMEGAARDGIAAQAIETEKMTSLRAASPPVKELMKTIFFPFLPAVTT